MFSEEKGDDVNRCCSEVHLLGAYILRRVRIVEAAGKKVVPWPPEPQLLNVAMLLIRSLLIGVVCCLLPFGVVVVAVLVMAKTVAVAHFRCKHRYGDARNVTMIPRSACFSDSTAISTTKDAGRCIISSKLSQAPPPSVLACCRCIRWHCRLQQRRQYALLSYCRLLYRCRSGISCLPPRTGQDGRQRLLFVVVLHTELANSTTKTLAALLRRCRM